jgi:hypothetical protein
MIVRPVPPISQLIIDEMESLVKSGAGQQQVITAMRAAGLHIGYCIKLFAQLYGVSLGEAKMVVHYSDAWASMRGEYDAFHEAAFEAAKEAAKLDGWEVEEGVALRNAS